MDGYDRRQLDRWITGAGDGGLSEREQARREPMPMDFADVLDCDDPYEAKPMKTSTNGEMNSINDAIDALNAARVDWCCNSSVYASLGVALRSLQATKGKASKVKAKEAHLAALVAAAKQARAEAIEALKSAECPEEQS